MNTGSYIELSRSALRKNLRFLRGVVGEGVTVSSVVKGNAYGHGIETFLPMAESCGVRHFSVFGADEAYRALAVRTEDSAVMIMGFIDLDELHWAVENDVQFYAFEPGRLRAAVEAARKIGRPARVHLELETGMNRTGLGGEELREGIDIVNDAGDDLVVEGVCTHYAGAESIGNYVRIRNQIDTFNQLCAELESMGLDLGRRHTACSAALLTYPETVMDMVRCGIAQYGFWPSTEVRMHHLLNSELPGRRARRDPLRRVLSWKTRVMSVKKVGPGQFVGYGTTYQTTRPETVACIPVGYFRGFARSLSNRGHVLIHGSRAPVVSIVNMSMCLVDVTHIADVRVGDEVTIIGTQGRRSISVASFSDLSNVMNYETLVRLPSEIPRTVVD